MHSTNMIPAWVDGTLAPVEKLAVHQQGLRHLAVSIFVLRDGDILLQRRALGKYHTPGLWANTCCTHPHWQEDPLDCAQRRLGQELGINGLDLSHRGQLEYRSDVGGGLVEHEVVDVYVSEAGSDLAIAPNPSEVMDIRWITPADLRHEISNTPDQFTPWLRIYMAEHAGRIFGSSA